MTLVDLRLTCIVICCSDINVFLFILKVMAAVGKLGQTVSVSPVGGALKSASADGVASEWHPAASDEEAMLHQLRAALLQARDAPPGETGLPHLYISTQLS